MQRTTITLPNGLSREAHELGINVSKTSADAVKTAVQMKNNKTGIAPTTATIPATAANGGDQVVSV
jgi:post-segregation antitoxin (ccd killing protein)